MKPGSVIAGHRAAYRDLRTELCDLRKHYLSTGWVDSGMEEGFDNLIDRLEQLENGERSPVEVVRRIVGECLAFSPSCHTRAEEMQFEDERVDRLMRLIRHREGQRCAE